MDTSSKLLSANSVSELTTEIKARLTAAPGELDEKSQGTLAGLLGLLSDLRKPPFDSLVPEWEIAVRALLASPMNQKFADDLYDRIRFKIRPSSNPLRAVIAGGTPPTRVILGLGTLLYFAIPGSFILLPKVLAHEFILGIKSEILLGVVFCGALGSIVSILVRIQDFGKAADADPSVLFMTGFFKPVIGSSFALFIYSVIKAGIIPIVMNQGSENYFIIALSFVSGFSERFARDVASATEKKINVG